MNNGIDIKSIRPKPNAKAASPYSKKGSEKSVWAFLNKDIQLGGGGVPDRLKEAFYIELSSLLESGVNIRSALELVRDEQTKQRHRLVFETVLTTVVNGASLSSSLEKTGKFSSYEYFSIKIGEETGQLVRVLKEMAIYFSKKIKQRRQITGALTYPMMVLLVAFSAVYFMISYVVPMFSDVFKRFGGELPALTKIIVSASVFFKNYAFLLLLLILSFLLACISQRKKTRFRAVSSQIILKIPGIKNIVSKIYLSRFANTMSLLVSAKIPMLQAVQMSRRMIGFYPIEQSLGKIEEHIMTGQSLHKSLAHFSIYPIKMIALVKVGEEVNQLDVFFSKIAEQYSAEVEYQTGILSKFIEPLIIVILGLVVGVILIGMYLPLFKLGQGF